MRETGLKGCGMPAARGGIEVGFFVVLRVRLSVGPGIRAHTELLPRVGFGPEARLLALAPREMMSRQGFSLPV
jgi:hypothetical protein